jgi:hypothetical protein
MYTSSNSLHVRVWLEGVRRETRSRLGSRDQRSYGVDKLLVSSGFSFGLAHLAHRGGGPFHADAIRRTADSEVVIRSGASPGTRPVNRLAAQSLPASNSNHAELARGSDPG